MARSLGMTPLPLPGEPNKRDSSEPVSVPVLDRKKASPLATRDASARNSVASSTERREEEIAFPTASSASGMSSSADQSGPQNRNQEQSGTHASLRESEGTECACCFLSFPLSELIFCNAGHGFCVDCVERYAQERLVAGAVLVVPPGIELSEQPQTSSSKSMSPWQWSLPCFSTEGCRQHLEVQEILSKRCPVLLARLEEQTLERTPSSLLPAGKRPSEKFSGTSAILSSPGSSTSPGSPEQRAEERMSEALIRSCPWCPRMGFSVPAQFVKEDGCNKMTCPKCGGMSCYLCLAAIPKEVGYRHFCEHAHEDDKS